MGSADGSAAQQGAATVRPLHAEDVDAILRIASESPEASNWSKESYAAFFTQSGALGLAIEAAGEIAGFLIGRQVADEAEILNVAIKRAYRRRGHASALLAVALEALRSSGAQSVYLEVRQSNAAAIAFYTKHGFAITGSRRAYYRNPPEDAIMMRKHHPHRLTIRKLTGLTG